MGPGNDEIAASKRDPAGVLIDVSCSDLEGATLCIDRTGGKQYAVGISRNIVRSAVDQDIAAAGKNARILPGYLDRPAGNVDGIPDIQSDIAGNINDRIAKGRGTAGKMQTKLITEHGKISAEIFEGSCHLQPGLSRSG